MVCVASRTEVRPNQRRVGLHLSARMLAMSSSSGDVKPMLDSSGLAYSPSAGISVGMRPFPSVPSIPRPATSVSAPSSGSFAPPSVAASPMLGLAAASVANGASAHLMPPPVKEVARSNGVSFSRTTAAAVAPEDDPEELGLVCAKCHSTKLVEIVAEGTVTCTQCGEVQESRFVSPEVEYRLFEQDDDSTSKVRVSGSFDVNTNHQYIGTDQRKLGRDENEFLKDGLRNIGTSLARLLKGGRNAFVDARARELFHRAFHWQFLQKKGVHTTMIGDAVLAGNGVGGAASNIVTVGSTNGSLPIPPRAGASAAGAASLPSSASYPLLGGLPSMPDFSTLSSGSGGVLNSAASGVPSPLASSKSSTALHNSRSTGSLAGGASAEFRKGQRSRIKYSRRKQFVVSCLYYALHEAAIPRSVEEIANSVDGHPVSQHSVESCLRDLGLL